MKISRIIIADYVSVTFTDEAEGNIGPYYYDYSGRIVPFWNKNKAPLPIPRELPQAVKNTIYDHIDTNTDSILAISFCEIKAEDFPKLEKELRENKTISHRCSGQIQDDEAESIINYMYDAIGPELLSEKE